MENVIGLLITYEWADVGDLECAQVGDSADAALELKEFDSIEESLVLQTCNRIELYASASDFESAKEDLFEFSSERMNLDVDEYAKFLEGEELVEHLLRLSSGLESMMVGEDQILGQIKEAYESCREVGSTGKTLEIAFEKAIRVGKTVRTETEINEGPTSVGAAAVKLAEESLGDLGDSSVLIIGAGETAELVGKSLVKRGPKSITVANRTYEKGKKLADELGGEAVEFSSYSDYLPDTDVVISATGAPHLVLREEDIKDKFSEDSEVLLIDIANPRDIAGSASEMDSVRLRDLDDLEKIADRNLEKREEICEEVEDIIEDELRLLEDKYKELRTDDTVSELYERVEKIRERELEKAIDMLDGNGHNFNNGSKEVIEKMTESMVQKILHDPISQLKQASKNGDDELIE
ncbi:MAG: glutamyl-tRNA reductase, partial [Candidatus Aenigmatarchaeota archaeon]